MRRRRRPTLHHAVKDKRVTVLGPVKQPEMDFMSHRGAGRQEGSETEGQEGDQTDRTPFLRTYGGKRSTRGFIQKGSTGKHQT